MTRAPEFYLGKPIFSLQTMLRQISFLDQRVLPVIPDGVFGPNTFAAVRSFQTAYGLPPTGRADLATWNAVADAYQTALTAVFAPTVMPFWPMGQTIRPGERDGSVYLVQAMLHVLAKQFSGLTAPSLTGALDQATAAGLRWVQAASDLKPTGELDSATWLHLNGLYRIAAGGCMAAQAKG